MSPVAKAATAGLPGLAGVASILAAFSGLPGSPNGSAVINFTDSNNNILAPPSGPSKVGVHVFSVLDYARHSHPLCDAGGDKISGALCGKPREIRVSMFYPTCPPEVDKQSRPVVIDEQYFAPVFEPSLVASISRLVMGDATAMHNVMSQAVKDAPICKDEYTMVMFTPAVGGQRQAYTQAASELASLGHIAVTVDHPYLSGLVELSDGTIQAGMNGDSIDELGAGVTQLRDITFSGDALTRKAELNRLPIWNKQAEIKADFCVFGHGLGGQVAKIMVDNNAAACGGRLEGLLTLPYPLNNGHVVPKPNLTVGENVTRNDTQPHLGLPDYIPISSTLRKLTKSLLKTVKDLVHEIACRTMGNCDSVVERSAIEKRSVDGGDHGKDWNYPDDEDFCDDDCNDSCDDSDDDFPPPHRPNDARPDDRPDEDGDWNDYHDDDDDDKGRRQVRPGNRCCPKTCRPKKPCDDGKAPWDKGCGSPRGGFHDHDDDIPDYPPHRGPPGHPHHGGPPGHHDDWNRHKGGECRLCPGPIGHDWENVGEGYKWDDHDYDYDDDDDDDEGDDDEDYDDDDDDDDDDGGACGDEGPCGEADL